MIKALLSEKLLGDINSGLVGAHKIAQIAATSGKQDARMRETSRECQGNREAFSGLVQLWLPPESGLMGVFRATEDDDPFNQVERWIDGKLGFQGSNEKFTHGEHGHHHGGSKGQCGGDAGRSKPSSKKGEPRERHTKNDPSFGLDEGPDKL
jgi:hypothetical protein